MPVDLNPSQAFIVHRHGWLCGTPGITPSIGQQSFRGGLWGGDGFILAHGLEPYLARQAAPQTAEAGAIGGIIGDIMRGQ
jgi:hypothetical protein